MNALSSEQPATWLSAWLYREAIPLWLEHGVDWNRGGFHESLNLRNLQCEVDFRRLYVAARQVYVFSTAVKAGVPRAAEAVELGLGFLRNSALQSDGGYAWRFNLANEPTDLTRDLYDHAFVLFGLASAAAVRPDRDLRGCCIALLRYIDETLHHPGQGWHESHPPRQPRRQNPHMHLLEALVTASAAFADEIFLDRADDVVSLCLTRFLHAEGGLAEFYTDDLQCLRDGAQRYVTEPGHHFEWVWLLARYQEVCTIAGHKPVLDVEPGIQRLMTFADQYGVSRSMNCALDEIYSTGEVKEGTARLWPQTERLKAVLRRPKVSNSSADQAINGLTAYLSSAKPGCWNEQRHTNGEFLDLPMQASSLYHLTCAILELARTVPIS